MLLRPPCARAAKCSDTLALNDVVVSRGSMGSMIELDVYIDGQFSYNLRSDGLIVSTPTGSTAYSLSSGGPILHPHLDAIGMVPISPHTLSNRPIVIAAKAVIEIALIRGPNACANFDVQSKFDLLPLDKVVVQAPRRTRSSCCIRRTTITTRCCAKNCIGALSYRRYY